MSEVFDVFPMDRVFAQKPILKSSGNQLMRLYIFIELEKWRIEKSTSEPEIRFLIDL